MMTPIVVVVFAGLLVWVVVGFNRLVRDRNLVCEGWSGVDVQLKRRHSLIPNLVEAVAGYGRHEKELLAEITESRSGSEGAGGVRKMQDRENALTDQLKRFIAVAEAYPDLKADRNYLELQKLLVEIEDQIQMARRYYNGAVRNYNVRVESFPGNVVARLTGFRCGEFFEVETATERAAPGVEM